MASILQCLIYFSFMMMSVYTEGNHFFYDGHQGGVSQPRLFGSEVVNNEVIPGSESFQPPQVSKECRHKSFCEDVPNYPKEYIKNLVAKAGSKLASPMNTTNEEGFVDRLSNGKDQEVVICPSKPKVISPKVVRGKQDDFYYVISDADYIQKFVINECNFHNNNRNCNGVIRPNNSDHSACCEQKYSSHMIAIEYHGKIAFTSIELPSFCKCAVTSQNVCPII